MSNRPESELLFTENSSVKWLLEPEAVKKCILTSNLAIELVHDLSLLYNIELFQLLGMRNLSSFIGEVFAKELRLLLNSILVSNPNQDGYPDLCALTPEGKVYIEEKKLRLNDGSLRRDKEFWSPYPFGGIEIKATCGNTPSASKMPKPGIGEARLPNLLSAEWKAHHQQTKILLGIYWDFVDGLPTVLAAFFRNDLNTSSGSSNKDWGAIIHPKEDGGRTTSVSIMKQGRSEEFGVKKMGQGWMVLPSNEQFQKFLIKIFGIRPETFEQVSN